MIPGGLRRGLNNFLSLVRLPIPPLSHAGNYTKRVDILRRGFVRRTTQPRRHSRRFSYESRPRDVLRHKHTHQDAVGRQPARYDLQVGNGYWTAFSP